MKQFLPVCMENTVFPERFMSAALRSPSGTIYENFKEPCSISASVVYGMYMIVTNKKNKPSRDVVWGQWLRSENGSHPT